MAAGLVAVAAVVVDGAGSVPIAQADHGSTQMKSAKKILSTILWVSCAATWLCLSASVRSVAQPSSEKTAASASASTSTGARQFDTPQQAAAALIDAADRFDVRDLITIFGHGGEDLILTSERPQDRKRAADFAAQAHEKNSISLDPKSGKRAFLIIGNENWPFPVPMVKRGGKWFFDVAAGRQEILNRRIGANELDAIAVSHRYVEAQDEYALKPRQGYEVNQYAQHIISTSGKQDGLAWQNPDGSWGGPLGEPAARAIEQGYHRGQSFHGYYFKILKGQGPAAPLGRIDYVVQGVMIGGFALVAAPAEYRVTGVKTFMVSNDGVVYQKDLGPQTLEVFNKMEIFNPDRSWTPVLDEKE